MVRLPESIRSIDAVCEVEVVAASDDHPDVLIELPHGATREADFERLRRRLDPELPEDLKDYFFVNTDAGSWEYGMAAARVFAGAGHGVLVVRSLVPRTFVDCNRIVEGLGERGTAGAPEHGITAAVPDYIQRPVDLDLLLALHRSYQSVAVAAFDLVCGRGGLGLTLHTYAPRTVGIDHIDAGIGSALRRAYAPGVFETWPVRPEVDLITKDPEGRSLADERLVSAVKAAYSRAGITPGENATYCLHRVTMGWLHHSRFPGQVLCMEARRDLLADPFTPFAEMPIGPEKARRIAGPLAAACLEHLGRAGG